jgi:hypothetical protein
MTYHHTIVSIVVYLTPSLISHWYFVEDIARLELKLRDNGDLLSIDELGEWVLGL